MTICQSRYSSESFTFNFFMNKIIDLCNENNNNLKIIKIKVFLFSIFTCSVSTIAYVTLTSILIERPINRCWKYFSECYLWKKTFNQEVNLLSNLWSFRKISTALHCSLKLWLRFFCCGNQFHWRNVLIPFTKLSTFYQNQFHSPSFLSV